MCTADEEYAKGLENQIEDLNGCLKRAHAEIGELADKYTALRAENDRLKALLRELEWFDGGWVEVVDQQVFMDFCPVCEGARPTHAKDCKLAEALR